VPGGSEKSREKAETGECRPATPDFPEKLGTPQNKKCDFCMEAQGETAPANQMEPIGKNSEKNKHPKIAQPVQLRVAIR
jgi:hypothetical protein